jgi:hypothetical protein
LPSESIWKFTFLLRLGALKLKCAIKHSLTARVWKKAIHRSRRNGVGGKNYSIGNNNISQTRGGNDDNVVFGGGITFDLNSVSYGTCDITANIIKDVDLIGGSFIPPLAVIQVNTSSTFDKLKILDNRYTGNTNGLGYFILCPDDTKVTSLIVAGNTTNTSLPTHLGP